MWGRKRNARLGRFAHEFIKQSAEKQKSRLSFLKRDFLNLAPLTGLELHLYLLLLVTLLKCLYFLPAFLPSLFNLLT